MVLIMYIYIIKAKLKVSKCNIAVNKAIGNYFRYWPYQE